MSEATTSLSVKSVSSTTLENELRGCGVGQMELIGKGTYSRVYSAYSDRLGKLVAVKLVDKRSRSKYVLNYLPRELEILRKLNHVNIVKVFEIVESDPFVAIVEEYASHGDLLKRINQQKRILEEDSKMFFRQLIEALIYLKSIELIHRDLKCENIFLDIFDNVKLGDFGFARFMHDGEVSQTFCGSRAYVAPEILRSQAYSGHTVDIWSAGIVLYVMVTGFMPYNDNDPSRMLERQMSHRISFPKRIQISEEVKKLIYIMLHPYPQKRATYKTILESRWLRNTQYCLKCLSTVTSVESLTSSSDDTKSG